MMLMIGQVADLANLISIPSCLDSQLAKSCVWNGFSIHWIYSYALHVQVIISHQLSLVSSGIIVENLSFFSKFCTRINYWAAESDDYAFLLYHLFALAKNKRNDFARKKGKIVTFEIFHHLVLSKYKG